MTGFQSGNNSSAQAARTPQVCSKPNEHVLEIVQSWNSFHSRIMRSLNKYKLIIMIRIINFECGLRILDTGIFHKIMFCFVLFLVCVPNLI